MSDKKLSDFFKGLGCEFNVEIREGCCSGKPTIKDVFFKIGYDEERDQFYHCTVIVTSDKKQTWKCVPIARENVDEEDARSLIERDDGTEEIVVGVRLQK